MTDPSEQIIAEALMSGDHERGMRRLTCNVAVRCNMFCVCGQTLDQFTVHVIERSGKTVVAVCPACWPRFESHVNEDPQLEVITYGD